MSDVLIRQMCKDDLDLGVMEIEKAAYGEHCWSRLSFEMEMKNNLAKYFCALKNDKLIGYLGSWFVFDEVHITTLAISPQFRKKNVAKRLLLKLIDECYKNEVKFITLEARPSNIPAINLYKKFGFNIIGKRRKYYQNNDEDALIMFTENIWYTKFKTNYEKLKQELTQ